MGRGYGDGDGDGDGFVPGEWRADGWHVADSAREMRRRVAADCDVDRLLTDFPNILAMDVPALFEDLRRVFPDKDPGDVLRRDPRIATRVRDDPIRSSTFPLPSDSPTFYPLAACRRRADDPVPSFASSFDVRFARRVKDTDAVSSLHSPLTSQFEKNTPHAWPLR